jgi:hypothetical protein
MIARTSASIFGLPGFFARDLKRQNKRNPAWCQETTVSGLTMTRTVLHPGHKSAKQNPKRSISRSQARARIFPLKNSQLLAKGKDLDTEVVAGTGKGFKAYEQGSEKWNHRPGFISQGTMAALL